jgi:regulatory protein
MATRKTPVPDHRGAMDAAMHLLKVRARGESELARRLVLKGFPPETARGAVERLKELQLVDDRALARQKVETLRAQGRGEIRIRQDLRRLALPRALVDEALAATAGEAAAAAEERRAWDALQRRAKRLGAGLDRRALYRRLGGFLGRQGFHPDVVRDALERFFSRKAAPSPADGDDTMEETT